VSEHDLDAWVNDGQVRMATAKLRLAAIKSLMRFARAKGVLLANPAELVTPDHRRMTIAQLEKRLVRPLTEAEYLQVLAQPMLPQHWRDWVVLAYCCGYRLTDCVCLQWDSFTGDKIVVYPKICRTARRLEISLADPIIARPELGELVNRMRSSAPTDLHHIWPDHCARFSGPLRGRFSTSFARLLAKCGIQGATFHSLRRACAVRLLVAGRSLEDIRETLGHSSIEITRLYTDSARNV
jgi:integrase/recombinase XerD